MKKRLLSILMYFCLVLTAAPMLSVDVNAATKGTADAFVAQAEMYAGKTLAGTKAEMRRRGYSVWNSNYSSDWCAWFVSACAVNSGNSSHIGTGTYADADESWRNAVSNKTVNLYGGKITFVNKTAYNAKKRLYESDRAKYDPSYHPKKGDLVLYNWGSYSQFCNHIAIVRKDSTNPKRIYAIGGNEGSPSIVRKQLRTSGIAAYVTPKYTNTKASKLATPTIKGIYSIPSTGKSKLVWADVKNANKYKVYRATSKTGTYSLVYTTPTVDVNTGRDHSVNMVNEIPGEIYYYKVRALSTDNKYEESLLSSYMYRTCDLASPCINLANNNGKAKLSWGKIDYANKYEVYRATSKFGAYKKISTTTSAGYTDSSKPAEGNSYYYKVRAFMNKSSAATSEYSNVVSITTPDNNSGDFDSGSNNPGNSFVVTEKEYETKYSDSNKYSATKLYRYQTRTKEYITSGYTTVGANGGNSWTKYDSKSTTSVSAWTWNKPVVGTEYENGSRKDTSVETTNYYYYFYGAANPNAPSNYTWYVASNRANVVSYLKQNYSSSIVWGESRLRYFWKLSPTKTNNLSVKNTRVNYVEDSTVSKGYFNYSGAYTVPNNITMYYYKPVYKSKVITTTNYFWRWSNWSGWSNWTTDNKASGDTIRKDSTVMYRITEK